MEAIILIGIQGCGKSTFYKEKYLNSHMRISNDLLKTKTRENLLLEYCKNTNLSFVVDNTNITKNTRKKYIQFAQSLMIPIIGYYFKTDIERSIKLNQKRTGKEFVPEIGILGTYKKLELPSIDEGFTQLYYVDYMDNNFKIMEWKDEI